MYTVTVVVKEKGTENVKYAFDAELTQEDLGGSSFGTSQVVDALAKFVG